MLERAKDGTFLEEILSNEGPKAQKESSPRFSSVKQCSQHRLSAKCIKEKKGLVRMVVGQDISISNIAQIKGKLLWGVSTRKLLVKKPSRTIVGTPLETYFRLLPEGSYSHQRVAFVSCLDNGRRLFFEEKLVLGSISAFPKTVDNRL